MYLKRAQENGASTWTCMIVVSWACAAVFPLLALRGGNLQEWHLFWQPAAIAGLFMCGQFCTFLAVKLGDVSIAAPVQGVKVLIVPALAVLLLDEPMTVKIWIAASIALVGIVCVQISDKSIDRSRIFYSVLFAVLASFAMTIFDLFISRWAKPWGAGYFLPLVFLLAAIMSLAFLPLADRPSQLKRREVWVPLSLGAMFMAVQAIGMTFTLATWGDPTRVNIVYSLRGLWGVLLTWALSRYLKIAQQRPSNKIMLARLWGAMLIGVSVIIAIT
jgi:drug/metabolite transporter (DMT)-like permease